MSRGAAALAKAGGDHGVGEGAMVSGGVVDGGRPNAALFLPLLQPRAATLNARTSTNNESSVRNPQHPPAARLPSPRMVIQLHLCQGDSLCALRSTVDLTPRSDRR